ncbi:MAG: hypothetical protein GY949_12815, partial [Gammaproteobacteria bacterium]|nr:hypothetical protein [Gammaproteobacteria bacterium]
MTGHKTGPTVSIRAVMNSGLAVRPFSHDDREYSMKALVLLVGLLAQGVALAQSNLQQRTDLSYNYA